MITSPPQSIRPSIQRVARTVSAVVALSAIMVITGTATDTPLSVSAAVAAGSKTVISGNANSIAVLSVGITNTSGPGYIQVLPCGETPGAYSHLNASQAGQTIANLVIAKFDANGNTCVYSHMATDIFVDLQGYLNPTAITLEVRRLIDTRTTPTTSALATQSRTKFSGTPNGLAVVSIIATQSRAPGYLQALPCAATSGAYSNLNVERPNQTIANLAIVQLDANGEACVYTHGGAHIVVDLQGYLNPSVFTPNVARRLDTRPGPIPLPGSTTPVAAGSPNQIAIMSIIATQTLAGGYIQALPCGTPNGAWSNVNTDHANQTIANLAFVRLDGNGSTCLYTRSGAHLIADVQGYLETSMYSTVNKRILDTRPPPPPPPAAVIQPGITLIESGAPAGRYIAQASSGCYWARLSGLGGTLNEIIANDFQTFPGPAIVDIKASDVAFEVDSDCGTFTAYSPTSAPRNTITAGAWVVGSDIQAGTYTANVSSGCYWERSTSFAGDLDSIIANDFILTAGTTFVTISPGDAGFKTDDDCGTWQRVS